MRIRISVGCETCSCGSIDSVIIDVIEGGGYDYECDNCGNTFNFFAKEVGKDTPLGLELDEEEDDTDTE